MAWRTLTTEEILLAQSIYGDTIDDYSSIKIYNEKAFPGQPDNTAVSPDGNVYFGPSVYSSNYANESGSRKGLFIHELGHIFQHQKGMDVLEQRLSEGGEYNYDAVFHGTPFAELPVEAQAEFFEDLYRKRNGIPVDAEKNGDGYLEYPGRPLSEYESVLPSNFPGGNPNIPPLNHFDPYTPPKLNAYAPGMQDGNLPADIDDDGSFCLPSIIGMQNGNGGIQFPAASGQGAEPLILDLNGDGAHATRLGYGTGSLSSTYFDMDNDGFAERTAWVSSGDGLLVMDKNSNGKIDNQTELFGNDATYANGFLNLKQYDSNNDNVMNASDTQWANLRVWVDANGDAVTDAGELKTLTELNITQINLAATTLTNTWDNENEVGATSTFVMNGQTQQVNDVWFRVDQTSSHYMADVTLNVATLFLPTLKGFGNLKDLHVAMSEDATLLTMVENFVTNTSTTSFLSNATLNTSVQNIMFRWAGIDGISPSATTQGLNTQTMMFLESITGYRTSYFNNLPPNQNVGANAAQVQAAMLSNLIQDIKAQLLVQIFGSQLIENAHYSIVTGDYSETPVLSAAGISKITADLNGIPDAQTRANYWTGLNNFLFNVKHITEYTQTEINGLNAIWATKGMTAGTWYDFAVNNGSQFGWQFNGSDLSDNLVGIDNAPLTIWGNGGDDFIKGGAYSDTLWGNAGNDTLNGGKSNDLLVGGSGNDTYIVELNSGPDRIDDESGYDTIKFGAGFDITQFSTRRGTVNNTDMEILFNGQLTLTIVAYYYPSGSEYTIEKVMFADGSFIELDKIANVVNGTTGNDSLSGHNGVDEFHGGTGNDSLYGVGGSDVYVFNVGNGIDTINESSGASDTVLMGAGITSANIRFEKSSPTGGDLIIYYSASDKVIISSQFYSEGYPTNHGKEVEFLKLADGTIYNLTGELTYTGTTGNDTVNGSKLNDILRGLAGTDSLSSGNGNDILNGGTGNDTLIGGAGDDTYVFNIGDGQDIITQDTGGNDTILMGAGITSANCTPSGQVGQIMGYC